MTKSLRERLMAEAVDAPYDGDIAAVLTPGEAIHIFAEWLESEAEASKFDDARATILDLSRTIRGE